MNNLSDIVLKMTNIEGRRVYGDNWENLDAITLEAYIGILMLAGVYRSHRESTKSLWNPETGRPIFFCYNVTENFLLHLSCVTFRRQVRSILHVPRTHARGKLIVGQ